MKSERDKYILKEEYHQFIKHCPEPYKLFWKVMFNAGLRISEGLAISVSDIMYQENKIVITTLKRKDNPRIPIIIPSELIVELKQYIMYRCIAGKLFNFSRQFAWKMFKQVCVKAGLNSKYSPHAFRHGHGIMIADLTNGNMIAIKNRLRHSSTHSTEFYVHLSEKKQQELALQIDDYLKGGAVSNENN